MNQLTVQLQQLHDQYVEQVNLAVAEDRDDLVDALSAEYTEAGLKILLTAAPAPALPDAA
jgi:hypothetical protein